jgi:hypothetical protein
MALPPDFKYFVISGLIILFIPVAVIAWFQAGFFWKFIAVKASRGQKILIKVRTVNRDYFRAGKVNDGFLIYKSLGKQIKRIKLNEEQDPTYSAFGVRCIDVDDEKNCVFARDGKGVSLHDAEKVDSLLTRCLMRPTLGDQKIMIIIIIVCVIALLVLVNMALTYSMLSKTQAMISSLNNITQSRVIP